MKLGYKLLAAVAGLMALSSCVEEAIGPLTGQYEKPVTYELNTLKNQSVEKGEGTRTFTVELANEAATLSMKFVSDKYYIADGAYTASPEAKKGTYLVGNGGSTFNSVGVESGTLTVTQGAGTYTFTGMLWLADESVIEVKSTVNLVYEADPEPVILKNVVSATSNVASGTNSLTINLATADVTGAYDAATWSTVYTGTGNYLALDIYSADGYLHEGTYTACAAGGAIAEGEFGIGWDPGDLWGIGMVFENWGTCWWDVNNGVTSINQKVTEGTVTVSKKGNNWTIELVSGEGKSMLWTTFTGAIEALTPAGAPTPEYVMTDKVEAVMDASWAVVAGVEKHTITLTKGEDVAAVFELITEEGATEIAGTYESQEYAAAPGLMGNGYSFPEWNVEGGSRYWVNGEMVLINPGDKMTVTKYAEGIYGFDGAAFSFVAAAEGASAGGDTPGTDYVEYTQLLLVQPNAEYDANYQPTGNYSSLTLKFGTDGMSSELVPNAWGGNDLVLKGSGDVLNIDFYTKDGTLAAGTYNACATAGTVLEGEFGIGYDVEMWGQQMVWGSCVTPYENDAAGEIAKITDGTITVEKAGDTYTITLESSLVNAQYVGALTL